MPPCKITKSKDMVYLHHNYYDFKLFQVFRAPVCSLWVEVKLLEGLICQVVKI